MNLFKNINQAIQDKINTFRLKQSLEQSDIKESQEFAAFDLNIDPDDPEFRRLNQQSRDLAPYKYERAVTISRVFKEKDPLYAKMLNVPNDGITSAGVRIKTDNEKVEELWEDFWNRPIEGFSNKFMGRDGLFMEAMVSGELNLPIGFLPNGDLEVATIDSLNIKDIKKLPGNALVDDKIVLKDTFGGPGKILELIRSRAGVMSGEVFRIAINKAPNAKRGKPLLVSLLDWVDLHEQGLFNEIARQDALRDFIWDVEVSGSEADAKALKEQIQKDGDAVKPGTIRVHNDNVKWSAVTPDLKAADGTLTNKMIMDFIVGSGGLTSFFVGFGGDVNQGVAREMQKVVVWAIEYQQDILVKILTALFTLRLQSGVMLRSFTSEGALGLSDDLKFKIIPNQIMKREFIAESAAFQQITQSVVTAKQSNLVGPEVARKQYAQASQELGFETTLAEIEEEFEGIEEPELDEFGNPKTPPVEQLSMDSILRMSDHKKKKKRKLAGIA